MPAPAMRSRRAGGYERQLYAGNRSTVTDAGKRYPHIKAFIREVLAQDPRPAYRKEEEAGKTYAVWLLDFNVRWRVIASGFEVFALEAR